MHRRSKHIQSILIILLGLACLTSAQSFSCPPITIDDLGNTTSLSSDGLVPLALIPPGQANINIPVRIMNYTIVCDASGARKNTSSYVSVVVQFQCDFTAGTDATLTDCDGSTILLRQYQFQCIEQQQSGQLDWAASVSGETQFVQTLNPTATLSTPVATQCRRCIDDQQSPTNMFINDTTHCDACETRCNQGQGRCFIGQSSDECCNFYLQGECVAQCPSPLVMADSSVDCVCPDISLANGSVSYSIDNRDIGSVATHTCNSGYRLSQQGGGATRTCSTNGWSGQSFTCERVTQCPELSISNGKVIVLPDDRGINSTAEYSCNGGYKLDKGDAKRTCQADGSWSGATPECSKTGLTTGAIVGIVIGVLVGVILLIVLVVVGIIAIAYKMKKQ